MANSDIIKQLFISYAKQDNESFHKLAQEYIDSEKRKNHNFVVKELTETLYNNPNITSAFKEKNNKPFLSNVPIPRDSGKGFPLFEIKEFYDIDWNMIVVRDETKNILKQIVKEFEDREILATYNLKHKNKILFCGKPGTGKTYAAQIICSILNIPLIYVRFDSIISSYLGETAANLRKIFDFLNSGNATWVVLFDEFDIIGKNRDDHYEHGEIKRVVNNFLQMIDGFTGNSIIVAATNHQHMLDPAIWRRFDEVIYFELPDNNTRFELFNLYLKPISKNKFNYDKYINKTDGFSGSDIKMMCIESIKHAIMNKHSILQEDDLDFALLRFIDRANIRKGKRV